MKADVGSPAPEIAAVDQDGQAWHLSAYRGRPVVLIFHRHLA